MSWEVAFVIVGTFLVFFLWYAIAQVLEQMAYMFTILMVQ